MKKIAFVIIIIIILTSSVVKAVSIKIKDEKPYSGYPWRLPFLVSSGPARVYMGIESCRHVIYYKHKKILDTGDYTKYFKQTIPYDKLYNTKEIFKDKNTHVTVWKSNKGKLIRRVTFYENYVLIDYRVFAYDNGSYVDGGDIKLFVIPNVDNRGFENIMMYTDKVYRNIPKTQKEARLKKDFGFNLSFIFDDFLYIRDNSTVFGWDGHKRSDKWNIPPQTDGIWGLYFSPEANKTEYKVLQQNEDQVILSWNSTEQPSIKIINVSHPELVKENESFNVSFIVINNGDVNLTDIHIYIVRISDNKKVWEEYINLSKDENITLKFNNPPIKGLGKEEYLITAENNKTHAYESYSVIVIPELKPVEIIIGPLLLLGTTVLFLTVLSLFIALYVSTKLKKEKPLHKCPVCGYTGEGGICPVCGSKY